MTALVLALWLVAGALTHLPFSEARDPWWLTVLSVLSWPIFAAVHFGLLEVTLAWGVYEGDDE